MSVAVVLIEVLHAAGLGPDRPELLPGAEGPVDHRAVTGAPELGPHERPALARLDVLELDNAEDLAVDLDVRAIAEFVGADHGGES